MDFRNVVCKLNKDDDYIINQRNICVNLCNKKKYHYTFWKDKRMAKLPIFFSDEALDLFYISLFVFYADRVIKRNSFSDAWTRKIKLHIPVLSISKWNSLKETLEKMLSFLSGDQWNIVFRSRELNAIEEKIKTKIESEDRQEELFVGNPPNKICMLSGGLDSFIGAIDLLQDTQEVLFVGHYGGGSGVVKFQEKVNELLVNKYSLNEEYLFNYYAAPVNGKEDTTRTRSFMFFAHAIILASALDKRIDLFIPENGLISLNIPLTCSRLGSSSTRTTHPYYMALLQRLLNGLGIMVDLKNPYQFKTKGEMVKECKDLAFLGNNIENTMSCSHPDHGRWKGNSEPSHCGTCLPCVIRRAAIIKASMQDRTVYRDKNFESGDTAVNNLSAYKIGIAKYNNKHINDFLQIQIAGPITSNHKDYVKLYNRGIQELIALLEKY